MSRVLLLTNRYPFAPGEEYLHTEIPYLATEFDEVLVLPLMRAPGTTHQRELPANVTVLDLQVQHGWKVRARLLADGLRMKVDAPDATSLKQRAYERYFAARTANLTDAATPVVERALAERNGGVDVIYAYWFYVTTSVAIGLRQTVPQLRDVPIVARGHGYDVNEAASPVGYLPQRRRMLTEVSRLHPTADTITERLQSEWPQFADKISTRRLGVVPPGVGERSNDGPLRVLSCSSLSPIKRLDLMARAVAECRRRGIDIEWTHLGAGTPRQEGQLRKTIEQEGVTDAVHRPGQMSNTEVYEVLRTGGHTVFLNTSSSESVSFSMSEAMGAGLPVVGTDVVGTHEILRDGRNGRLIEADPSPAAVADALDWIRTRTPQQYRELCDASEATCRELLDPATLYADFAAGLRTSGSLPHER